MRVALRARSTFPDRNVPVAFLSNAQFRGYALSRFLGVTPDLLGFGRRSRAETPAIFSQSLGDPSWHQSLFSARRRATHDVSHFGRFYWPLLVCVFFGFRECRLRALRKSVAAVDASVAELINQQAPLFPNYCFEAAEHSLAGAPRLGKIQGMALARLLVLCVYCVYGYAQLDHPLDGGPETPLLAGN